MPQLLRSRRSYDHRIREIVCQTGNPRIFHHLRIPRSTTASWLSRGCRSVVSLGWQHDMASVLEENERLKRRAERQTAIIRLLVVLLKLSGFRLDEQRLPDGKAKAGVLRAIDRTKDVFPLKSALRLVRLSPARYEKPKTGIRATHPNEYWHIDVTVIRLLDDTKCYLHAVIDNFSRRILSWRLTKRLAPTTTCEILKEAAKDLGLTPTVVADSGVDNVNARVDQLMADGIVHRVLAQVEVSFSNSMIEAFWRSLRHQWLYLHSLDSFTHLEQLIDFYVREHNTQMPHHAFVGQTPDEIYFGQADGVRDHLTAARHQARRQRMDANQGQSCGVCGPPSTQQSVSVFNAVANAPP